MPQQGYGFWPCFELLWKSLPVVTTPRHGRTQGRARQAPSIPGSKTRFEPGTGNGASSFTSPRKPASLEKAAGLPTAASCTPKITFPLGWQQDRGASLQPFVWATFGWEKLGATKQ